VLDQQQRQWELNRLNFEGRWKGRSYWYLRNEALNYVHPSRVIDDTCYTSGSAIRITAAGMAGACCLHRRDDAPCR